MSTARERFEKELANYEACYRGWETARFPAKVVYQGRLQESDFYQELNDLVDAEKFFSDWNSYVESLAALAANELRVLIAGL